MITICWSPKGGSGTTVIAAAYALSLDRPTVLIDLAGDLPAVLGLPEPERPGLGDWLRSDVGVDRLDRLALPVDDTTSIVPLGAGRLTGAESAERWQLLARHLAADPHAVVVDAGTGSPPPALHAAAERQWIVTRACYLALRAAARQHASATGVVLVGEPGRSLRRSDVEIALGAPVVAEVLVDPAVARAVDAGLLAARLPGAFRRRLREAA